MMITDAPKVVAQVAPGALTKIKGLVNQSRKLLSMIEHKYNIYSCFDILQRVKVQLSAGFIITTCFVVISNSSASLQSK